jgi:protein-disulfide isomerase
MKEIEKLTMEDKKVRVIFKELPILGESSEIIAKASIAFNKLSPKKYFDFHRELMTSNARSTEDVAKVAQKYGVSESELKKALDKYKKEILAEIEFNRELSRSIGINGTPAFIIGETILPGAVPLDTLKNEIKKERAK